MEYHLVYQLFPRSFGINDEIKSVIECFEKNYESIKSPDNNLSSDGVLKVISKDLEPWSIYVGYKPKKVGERRPEGFIDLEAKLKKELGIN